MDYAYLQIAKMIDYSTGARTSRFSHTTRASRHVIARMLECYAPILPIIGCSQPAQLPEHLAAPGVALTRDQMERLDWAGNPEIKQAWLR